MFTKKRNNIVFNVFIIKGKRKNWRENSHQKRKLKLATWLSYNKMIIYTLLLLTIHIYDSHSLDCANCRAGSCYCSSSSHDQVLSTSIFCPDANTPTISLVLQENQYLTIKCIRRVSMDEVVTYLAQLNIGNSSFVKLTGCPIPLLWF